VSKKGESGAVVSGLTRPLATKIKNPRGKKKRKKCWAGKSAEGGGGGSDGAGRSSKAGPGEAYSHGARDKLRRRSSGSRSQDPTIIRKSVSSPLKQVNREPSLANTTPGGSLSRLEGGRKTRSAPIETRLQRTAETETVGVLKSSPVCQSWKKKKKRPKNPAWDQ